MNHDHIETLNRTYWKSQLQDLIKEADTVSGQWNGDEAGFLEDIAHNANEVRELAQKVLEELEEL